MADPLSVDSNVYKFKSIDLVNYRGEKIDIKSVVADITITESIYSLFMVYEFSIGDGMGLMEKFAITGNETVELTIFKKNKHDDNEDMRVKKLMVVSIDNYQKSNETTSAYKIRCVLQSAVVAMAKRVSRSFSGSVDQMLKKLTADVIKETINWKSGSSIGNFKYVAPNISYIDTIGVMTQANINDNGGTAHLFETLWSDFIYESYTDMVVSEPVMSYKYTSKNKYQEGTDEYFDEQIQRIKQIKTNLGMSLYESLKRGAYMSRMISVNPFDKKFEKFEFSIFNSQVPMLSKDAFLRPELTISGVNVKELIEPKVVVRLSNTGSYDSESTIVNPDPMLLLKKYSTFNRQFGLSQSITVDGNSDVRAGSVIELDIPPSHGPEMDRNKEDKIMSGKYVVVNVIHQLESSGRYSMRIDCKKDSIDFSALPKPELDNGGVR